MSRVLLVVSREESLSDEFLVVEGSREDESREDESREDESREDESRVESLVAGGSPTISSSRSRPVRDESRLVLGVELRVLLESRVLEESRVLDESRLVLGVELDESRVVELDLLGVDSRVLLESPVLDESRRVPGVVLDESRVVELDPLGVVVLGVELLDAELPGVELLRVELVPDRSEDELPDASERLELDPREALLDLSSSSSSVLLLGTVLVPLELLPVLLLLDVCPQAGAVSKAATSKPVPAPLSACAIYCAMFSVILHLLDRLVPHPGGAQALSYRPDSGCIRCADAAIARRSKTVPPTALAIGDGRSSLGE